MKKNERFDDILNACLDRLLKGDTIEQCLKSYSAHARELEPLLRTAAMAKQASEIQPRPEFKARARYEFQSAVKEMQIKKEGHRWFSVWQWHPRLALAVVAVFLFVAAGGGTVAAASNSMPESALYPVKLTAEQVQLALTFSAVGKAELNARFANERVTEIIYAASRGDTRNVLEVAGRLNNNLQNIGDLIVGEGTSESTPATTSGNALSAASNSAPEPMIASGNPVPSPTNTVPTESAPMLRPAPGLAAPSIIFPQPGATNVPVNPTFSWPQVNGATGYEFQLADNPEFVNPIESVTNLTTNSYALTKTLDNNAIYFWRYRSLNGDAGAKGDWVQNGFTTGTEFTADTPVPSLPPAALAVPQTTNPVNGKKLTDIEKLTQQIAQYANANSAHLEEALNKSPAGVKPALRQAISRTSAEYNKLIQQLDKASKEK